MTANVLWSLKSWHGITGTWVTSTFLTVWQTDISCIDVPSGGRTTKLFFHLLDLTVLNSWILLSSCGAKCTHKDFRLLARNLIEEAWRSHYRPTPTLVGRPSAAAANVIRLDSCHNKQWPAKHKNHICCRVCSELGQRRTTINKCAKCDVGLCMVLCFADYHTKTNL